MGFVSYGQISRWSVVEYSRQFAAFFSYLICENGIRFICAPRWSEVFGMDKEESSFFLFAGRLTATVTCFGGVLC